jgi:hypothetical protein
MSRKSTVLFARSCLIAVLVGLAARMVAQSEGNNAISRDASGTIGASKSSSFVRTFNLALRLSTDEIRPLHSNSDLFRVSSHHSVRTVSVMGIFHQLSRAAQADFSLSLRL